VRHTPAQSRSRLVHLVIFAYAAFTPMSGSACARSCSVLLGHTSELYDHTSEKSPGQDTDFARYALRATAASVLFDMLDYNHSERVDPVDILAHLRKALGDSVEERHLMCLADAIPLATRKPTARLLQREQFVKLLVGDSEGIAAFATERIEGGWSGDKFHMGRHAYGSSELRYRLPQHHPCAASLAIDGVCACSPCRGPHRSRG
jgi:hypothetical protein